MSVQNSLPEKANLDFLKDQAKRLLKNVRNQNTEALALAREFHPKYRNPSADPGDIALHDAQLIIARQHGFVSWTKLKEEIDRRNSTLDERMKQFVLDATREKIDRARKALNWEPELADVNLWTQLVTGNITAIRDALKRDPSWINKRQGPHNNWQPIHYICFSRFQMENAESQSRFTECARALLDAGGDANAFWTSEPWPDSPLRALYGVTGVNNNPSLARLLLERGAEVNDGESIYHAAQFYHLESMEVLREFKADLGRNPYWKNTPVYFLLSDFTSDNGNWATSFKGIHWLLENGCDPNIPCGEKEDTALHAAIRQGHNTETIKLLLEFGADPNKKSVKGITPIQSAQRTGRKDLLPLLKQHGGQEVELTVKEKFFEAVLSGERKIALAFLTKNPQLAETFDEGDRLTLNRAAETGNIEAVRILLDAGFDITFKGAHEWGSTPLHISAWKGWAEVVDLLLSRGAPIDILANKPEESPPFGWAAHGSGYCHNLKGDYPRVARSLLSAGATAHIEQAEMSSLEVAEVIYAAVAGRKE